jgi:hypothetical protein
MMRFGLIAAVTAVALLVPTRAASQTPPPVIEVVISLTDLPPAVVNVSVPDAPAIVFPEQPAPVVNVTIPEREVTVTAPPPQVIIETVEVVREVPVDRIVEVEVEVIVVCNPAIQPDRRAVILSAGVVTGIMAGNPGQQFTDFVEGNPNYVEITCLPVQPQVGWTYDGEVFAPPS